MSKRIPGLGSYDIVLYLPTITPGLAKISQSNMDEAMYNLHSTGIDKIYNNIQSCELFIYFSSGVFYLKNDESAYRKSKILGEANLQSLSVETGLNYLILRNMEVYGPYLAKHKIYRKLCEACANGKQNIEVNGDGNNLIDTMYIDDYIKILMNLIKLKVKNTILPFSRSKPVTIKKMASVIADVFNRPKFEVSFKGEPTECVRFSLQNNDLLKYSGVLPSIDLYEGIKMWKNTELL